MFEGLQKHSQSFFLILLVASVAMIFGINWGPGARGCSEGHIAITYAARVYNYTISESELTGTQRILRQLTPPSLEENPATVQALYQGALDGLIERELLAHEAERVGFRVTEQQVNDEMRSCRLTVSIGAGAEGALGSHSGPVQFPRDYCGGFGDQFNFQTFERTFRRVFSRTVPDIRESQVREMLAQRMRESVVSSVQVSDEEMWRDYQRSHDQMAVKYVRFALSFYRDMVHDDDAQAVSTWAAAHPDEINRQWEHRRESLRGLHREIRVRHILVKFPGDTPTDAQKAETRVRAEAIRTRVVAGEDFVRLARLYSDDPGSWRTGGELGWRQPDGEQGYVPEFTAAANALQPGATSPVTETHFGYHIIQLLGVREGDVSEADGKRDLARTLYRESRAAELAQAAADDAQHRITAGQTLDDVARAVHATALHDFYRGDVPAPVTLPGGATLSPVAHTDLDAPDLKESEQFARNGQVVPDLTQGGEALIAAAFALTPEHPQATAPVHAGDDFFLLRFKDNSRTVATREEFNRQRMELLTTTYSSMMGARQREALVLYIAQLRQDAEHAGKIRIGNSPRLRPPVTNPNGEDENGN